MDRNVSLDFLKLLLSLMVVALHAKFLSEYSTLGSFLTVDGIFRIAVPIFLIINGFYFHAVVMKGNQSAWLKRITLLYLSWMLIYSYFWVPIPVNSLVEVATLLKAVVFGYWHLWYISGMLGASILVIIFKKSRSERLLTSVFLTFLAGCIMQYLGNYHAFEGTLLDRLMNMNWVHRNAIFFSYPFFCIGYLINKHQLHNRITFKTTLVTSAIGLILLLLESWINYHLESRDGGFDNYFTLLFTCPFLFILFTKFEIRGSTKNIALYSSAIYFVHIFFILILREFSALKPTTLTISSILLSVLTAYFLIKINQRTKWLL